ncbi:TonB-dependent receptor domain-containing protein [Tepidicaulis sp. LMO-SS28]|uniref:TonB-dependent receptor domain-containing protein n=1 Tax=Tepidicaulis sp. LMO-SS28 TaxID=3447455 RepID=UPI003EDF4224
MSLSDRSRGAAQSRRNRSFFVKALLTGTALAGGALSAMPPALAQQPAAEMADAETRAYAIPAGPLAPALNRFADESGLQLIYGAEVTEGQSTEGVSGSFTADGALTRLLAGTGIAYSYAGDDTIALSPAPAAGDEALMLGPITVTAERRERSLRDTAASVAVFDATSIEERPEMKTANDLLALVPNVVTTGTNNFAPAIRGVDGTGPAQGADAFLAGTRPRLNIQVDGRPLSYNEIVFGDVALWDVEQVEVLRGAQSTLQGRNAIAGTVAIKTKDPTYHTEAGGRVIMGDQSTRQYSAYASGPILDNQLAFRVAVDRQERESYTHMTSYGDVDPEEFASTMLRGKLLIEPDAVPEWRTLLTVNHSDVRGPQVESVRRPFDEHASGTPAMPTFNPSATSLTLDTSWQAFDLLGLELTGSYTDTQIVRRAPAGTGNAEINGKELMLEPRLRFESSDGRLTGIAGVYYFHADQEEAIDFPAPSTFDDETETVAAFGEATYAVLDDLDVTAGLRAEQETRKRTGGVAPFDIDLDEEYDALLPKLGLAWHTSEEWTVGALVSRGYNGGGAGFTYNFPFESYTFDPEYVWTYEAYARGELLDDRLELTGNIFYSEYTDMQLPFDLNPDPAVWSVVIRNADEAVTYGAEFGARWLAAPGLELFGSAGLLQTEVTEYPGSNIEGHELAQAPAFTSTAGFSYVDESGFDLGADVRFSDAYYSSIENNPRGKTDPYVVVNARAGYTLDGVDGSPRIFGFVNNVFDADEPLLIEPGGPPAADDIAYLITPRMIGIGLEVNF